MSLLFSKRVEKSQTARKIFKKPWPNHAEDYDFLYIIGVGSHATIYNCRCKDEEFQKEEIAIKVYDIEKIPDIESIRKEIQFIYTCDHPNILQYYTSFVRRTKLYVVCELLEGSLLDLMNFKFPHGIKDKILLPSLLKQVLMGLDYLHSNGRAHRNIKASNILLDKQGRVRLADFGASTNLFESGSKKDIRYTLIGTFAWMAPEVFESQTKGYDSMKADIWSFGITMIELATGKSPYAGFDPMKAMIEIINKPPPIIHEESSLGKYFGDMVGKCLQKDPNKRATVKELLNHKFMLKLDKVEGTIVEKFLDDLPSIEMRAKMLNSNKHAFLSAESPPMSLSTSPLMYGKKTIGNLDHGRDQEELTSNGISGERDADSHGNNRIPTSMDDIQMKISFKFDQTPPSSHTTEGILESLTGDTSMVDGLNKNDTQKQALASSTIGEKQEKIVNSATTVLKVNENLSTQQQQQQQILDSKMKEETVGGGLVLHVEPPPATGHKVKQGPTPVHVTTLSSESNYVNPFGDSSNTASLVSDLREKVSEFSEATKNSVEKLPQCSECDKRMAILFCSNCKSNQCAECALEIHINPKFKSNLKHQFKQIAK